MTERRSKYNAKPVSIDGYHFDSQAEYARYRELRLLEQNGDIRNLTVHPTFELQPAFTHAGVNYRAIKYEVDFAYIDVTGCHVTAEDVKGFETAVFKLKLKMMLYKYPGIHFVLVQA